LKLSDFLLFPETRLKTDDGLSMTMFGNDPVEEGDVQDYLQMLVRADSENEVRMVLTLAWNDWTDGKFDVDVGEFFEVYD